MSNLGILLKNNIYSMLGAFQGKKKRTRNSIVLAISVLIYIAICLVFALQVMGLFQVMKEVGIGEIPLFNSFQVVFMMLIILAFQQLTGKSKTNDSDLLLSLPLKKSEIVLSKTISKYLFALLLISMIILPTLVLYMCIFGFAINVLLWGLLLMLILPLFSVGLNYLLDFLVVRLFNRIKFANLIKIIFALLLFGAFLVVYIYNSSVMGTIDFTNLDSFLNKNFIIAWCVRLMLHNNLLNLLYLVLLVFGTFALGVFAYSSIFGKTFATYRSKQSSDYKVKTSSMFGKELKRYFTTPIYIFNTIIGPILLVILTVYLLIKGKDVLVAFGIADKTLFFGILTLIYLSMSAMTLISCCSISLEGRYLWILKSTPVSTNKILLSKSLVNVVIFVPVQLITSLSLAIVFKATAIEFVLFLILPMLSNLILSFGGTYINLLLPKLTWENEAQVVKQGVSVLVTMLIGFVITLIPVVFTLCGLSITLSGLISLGAYLLLFVLTLILLFVDGKKKFEKLEL